MKKIFYFLCASFIALGISSCSIEDFLTREPINEFSAETYFASEAELEMYANGMLNSYIINRSWTFRSDGAFFGPQMRRFIAVNLSLLILSLVVLHVGMDVFGLKKLPAKLCATALTVVLGFALNRLWVFRT